MRILIDNSGYELLNLGDLAMLQVAVKRFRTLWADASISILTVAPEQLAICCPGTRALAPTGRELWLRRSDLVGALRKVMPRGFGRVWDLEQCIRRRWPNMMRELADERLRYRGLDSRPMIEFLDTVLNADLVVGTGGGYLTDSFKFHGGDVLETLHLAACSGIPTALLGQGIGPAEHEFILRLMRRTFPSIGLFTLRERLTSRPLALEMGADPRRIIVTGDDAIEPAYEARPATLGNAIGINLRTTWYAGVPDSAPAVLRQAISDTAARLAAPIAPLPVSAHSGGEDERAIAELTQGLVHDFNDAVENPEALIRRVGLCRVVVTGSYHAGVFALAQGIPVIALAGSEYYVNKFLGLAEQFPAGVTIVRLDDARLAEKIVEATTKSWNDAPALRPGLLAAANSQIQAGLDAYRKLADLVHNRSRRHERAAPVRADAGL